MKRTAPSSPPGGFTLIELLTVMAIIAILAALVLAGAGYANKKANRDRVQVEIKALSVALEAYKLDYGTYPRDAASTDTLDPATAVNPSSYTASSLVLYKALSGDEDLDAERKTDDDNKRYFEFKPNMLSPTGGTGAVTAITDPFGNSYGYSTIYAADVEAAAAGDPDAPTTPSGNNPTFDLWSTSGGTSDSETDKARWISNW